MQKYFCPFFSPCHFCIFLASFQVQEHGAKHKVRLNTSCFEYSYYSEDGYQGDYEPFKVFYDEIDQALRSQVENRPQYLLSAILHLIVAMAEDNTARARAKRRLASQPRVLDNVSEDGSIDSETSNESDDDEDEEGGGDGDGDYSGEETARRQGSSRPRPQFSPSLHGGKGRGIGKGGKGASRWHSQSRLALGKRVRSDAASADAVDKRRRRDEAESAANRSINREEEKRFEAIPVPGIVRKPKAKNAKPTKEEKEAEIDAEYEKLILDNKITKSLGGGRPIDVFPVQVTQMVHPIKARRARKMTEPLVRNLMARISKRKISIVAPLLLVAKGVKSIEDFDHSKMESYKFEILGGNHTQEASLRLYKARRPEMKFEDQQNILYKNSTILADNLTDAEARTCGLKHNLDTEFTKDSTFMDRIRMYRDEWLLNFKDSEGTKENKIFRWQQKCLSDRDIIVTTSREIGKYSPEFVTSRWPQDCMDLLEDINDMFMHKRLKGDDKGKGKTGRRKKPASDVAQLPILGTTYITGFNGLDRGSLLNLLQRVKNKDLTLKAAKDVAMTQKMRQRCRDAVTKLLRKDTYKEVCDAYGVTRIQDVIDSSYRSFNRDISESKYNSAFSNRVQQLEAYKKKLDDARGSEEEEEDTDTKSFQFDRIALGPHEFRGQGSNKSAASSVAVASTVGVTASSSAAAAAGAGVGLIAPAASGGGVVRVTAASTSAAAAGAGVVGLVAPAETENFYEGNSDGEDNEDDEDDGVKPPSLLPDLSEFENAKHTRVVHFQADINVDATFDRISHMKVGPAQSEFRLAILDPPYGLNAGNEEWDKVAYSSNELKLLVKNLCRINERSGFTLISFCAATQISGFLDVLKESNSTGWTVHYTHGVWHKLNPFNNPTYQLNCAAEFLVFAWFTKKGTGAGALKSMFHFKESESRANVFSMDGVKSKWMALDEDDTTVAVNVCQKPIRLLRLFIEYFTETDEVVLDLCSGTASTAVACVLSNRNCVSVESNAFQTKKARARLSKLQDKVREWTDENESLEDEYNTFFEMGRGEFASGS